jgi:hypothetical protein
MLSVRVAICAVISATLPATTSLRSFRSSISLISESRSRACACKAQHAVCRTLASARRSRGAMHYATVQQSPLPGSTRQRKFGSAVPNPLQRQWNQGSIVP